MNLSEGNRENLQKKIEALMREGLKITDIMFENIERKVSRQTGRSGIVIVTCMSWADKDRILKAKGYSIRAACTEMCPSSLTVHENREPWKIT